LIAASKRHPQSPRQFAVWKSAAEGSHSVGSGGQMAHQFFGRGLHIASVTLFAFDATDSSASRGKRYDYWWRDVNSFPPTRTG